MIGRSKLAIKHQSSHSRAEQFSKENSPQKDAQMSFENDQGEGSTIKLLYQYSNSRLSARKAKKTLGTRQTG